MSEWKKVKLGDILQVKKGDYITKKEAREGIYPVILGGKEPAYFIDKYNHTGKAIVISRSGASAGYVSFWNEPIFVTDGFLIDPKGEMTYEFLYYALKSKQAILHKAQKGAAIPHVTPLLIGNIDFLLPDKDTQHRIATILSRYDSLIENYQKQIKLLEEAAQRLYKEWFVDLHFPGHENTKIVDGVPEGWEKKKVGEIANISAGGDKPEVVTEEKTTCCQVPIYSNGTTKEGLYGYTNKSSNIAGSITVSARGSIGFACLRMHDYFSIVRLISIKPYQNEDLMYLFQFVKVHTFISNGAAQQQLTVPMVKAIDIVYPTGVLLKAFESAVLPIYKQIEFLKSQIRLLTEARDRLLPKLMSGEIEI